MKAEPYICIKSYTTRDKIGEIDWFEVPCKGWQPYADFERSKLKELGAGEIGFGQNGYSILVLKESESKSQTYFSHQETNYRYGDYYEDTESNRLLKRAEFLRKVCEAEGVEWLPKCACNPCQKSEKSLQDCNSICKCNCHKTELPYSREEVDARVEALLNLIDPANYDKKQFRSKFLHG